MKTLFAAAVTVSMLMGTAATAYADNDRDHGQLTSVIMTITVRIVAIIAATIDDRNDWIGGPATARSTTRP